ncbi:hypothetical protein BS78_K105800 [Paspalum vaginatum]|uniref:Uncharacterized protein n=1 Tax=Paspalum vaginatum TaxID=158149 RepID=A0A9W7XCC5_9POAL|nr:hypothetical protein BS78_K105800 [Paspalum vaginatum]
MLNLPTVICRASNTRATKASHLQAAVRWRMWAVQTDGRVLAVATPASIRSKTQSQPRWLSEIKMQAARQLGGRLRGWLDWWCTAGGAGRRAGGGAALGEGTAWRTGGEDGVALEQGGRRHRS